MTVQAEEQRFGFGRNWADYVDRYFSPEVVDQSQRALLKFIRRPDLKGSTFLDIGCGSGLHSLAAYRSEAERLHSFDYDENSVATTRKLRDFEGNPKNWTVERGSVLDRAYMEKLDKYDIVYSWGVLHHTGDTWTAVKNALVPLKPGGIFYIALYASEMYIDPPASYWLDIKRRYNAASDLGKRRMEWSYALTRTIIPELRGLRNPFKQILGYETRGMRYWTDVRDWLGGWPIDFVSLKDTAALVKQTAGLDLVNALTGEGCTEYLFCDLSQNEQWKAIVSARQLSPIAGPFQHLGGNCYQLSLPELASRASSNSAPRGSELMLYEDDEPLYFRNSLHSDIRVAGQGRFSHWGDSLFFSASDNSDPNTNGRHYAYCLNY